MFFSEFLGAIEKNREKSQTNEIEIDNRTMHSIEFRHVLSTCLYFKMHIGKAAILCVIPRDDPEHFFLHN